jgi:hypothetical protein
MTPCPYCNKNIAEGIPFCPYCGSKQQNTLSKEEINKNPYTILQIAEDAEQEVIDAAYRSLARKYHPDTHTNSVSEERMREINWAHGILSDPEKTLEWKRKQTREKQRVSSSPTPSSTSKSPAPSPVSNNQTSSSTQSNISSAYYQAKSTRKPILLIFLVLIFIVFLGLALIWVFGSIFMPSVFTLNTSTPPSAQQYQQPPVTTHPPPLSHTATFDFYNIDGLSCIPWTSLRNSDIGYRRCVYGIIVKIYSSGDYPQIIRFSAEAGTFLIWGENWYFTDIETGMCVAAVGTIESDASELFMDIATSELYDFSPGCSR